MNCSFQMHSDALRADVVPSSKLSDNRVLFKTLAFVLQQNTCEVLELEKR